MVATKPGPLSAIAACAKLTFANWPLAVPTVVAALLTLLPVLISGGPSVLRVFSGDGSVEDPQATVPAMIGGFTVSAIVGILAGIIAFGTTYVGAGDVLRGRPVDLRSILRRGTAYFGTIFLFALIIGGIGLVVELIVAGLLAITGGFLEIILVPLFFCVTVVGTSLLMYTIPAIVMGGRSAGDAIGQSVDLARENFNATASVMAGLFASAICVWGATFALHYVPVAGPFAILAVDALFAVFQALLVSKTYLELMKSASPPMPMLDGEV